VAGGVAGALVFGGFISLGMLLTARVANVAPVVILAIAGAYAGWLLGVIVFSAVRSAGAKDEQV
jgi:hypothetical protein